MACWWEMAVQGVAMGGLAAVKVVEPVEVAADRSPIVVAERLGVTFQTSDGSVTALTDITLQIAQGDFISLIGPSGCGKTTLLRVIADLVQPTSGKMLVNGVTPAEARRQRLYGYVFQAPALYPWRTVRRNVMLPLEVMGLPREERLRRSQQALDTVSLGEFAKKFPWQLSGGMQQRVSIARALSFSPQLLLMDEPFGALDEITRDNLNLHLSRLWDTNNLTVIFVTHSIPEAVFLSSRIVVMSPHPGRIAEIIDCHLPRKRELDLRDTSQFHAITARVREALRRGRSYE